MPTQDTNDEIKTPVSAMFTANIAHVENKESKVVQLPHQMISMSHPTDSTSNILASQSVEKTKPTVQNVENKTVMVSRVSRSEGVCTKHFIWKLN